ncbi:MAG: DUF4124 domain-containing protein [Acidovorax sp.]|nr:MAG: DUF4124 domain-containing protein [Acidovorax sp.]
MRRQAVAWRWVSSAGRTSISNSPDCKRNARPLQPAPPSQRTSGTDSGAPPSRSAQLSEKGG